MYVLILALRRGIINMNFASLFFWAKWLSHSFDSFHSSCPAIFWLLKKATKTLNFLLMFLVMGEV